MTIRHLNTFIKVCELGSISKTAEELCVAQPSVSQTIKELESYYDVCLFNRVNRRLVLTKDGQLLLAKAKDAVRAFNDFEDLARQVDNTPDIYIGATMAFGEIILPIFINRMKEELPCVDPRLIIDKPDALIGKLLRGDLDFAIIEGLVSDPNLTANLVGKDRLVLVASPSYSCPASLKLEDLIKYELLVREPGSAPRRVVDYRLAIKGLKIENPRMESSSNLVVISMAINGMGIGILAEHLVQKYIESGELKEIKLDTPLERNLFLVHHKNKKFSSGQRKAYKLCEKILTQE